MGFKTFILFNDSAECYCNEKNYYFRYSKFIHEYKANDYSITDLLDHYSCVIDSDDKTHNSYVAK